MIKTGNNIIVRHHTDEEKEKYVLNWVREMDPFEGNICTVVQKLPTDGRYTIQHGTERYNFLESSLIPLNYEH